MGGGGVQLQYKNFSLGIAVPSLLGEIKIKDNFHNNSTSAAPHRRGSIGYLKYQWTVLGNWQVKPSVLFQKRQGSPLYWQTSAVASWKKKLWIGGSYDSNVFTILANWRTKIGIGIGYEISNNLTDISLYTTFNHEFNLCYWLH